MADDETHVTRRNGRDAKVCSVRFRDPDGRQREETFGEEGDANRFATVLEADRLRALSADHADRTVAQYARAQAPARPHRASTAERVLSGIDVHVVGTRLGGRRLAAGRSRPGRGPELGARPGQILVPSPLRAVVRLLPSID